MNLIIRLVSASLRKFFFSWSIGVKQRQNSHLLIFFIQTRTIESVLSHKRVLCCLLLVISHILGADVSHRQNLTRIFNELLQTRNTAKSLYPLCCRLSSSSLSSFQRSRSTCVPRKKSYLIFNFLWKKN